MHGRVRTWLAAVPVVVAACAGAGRAQGPGDVSGFPADDPAYGRNMEAVYSAPEAGGTTPTEDALAARVAELEARLDAAAKKDADAKKKAAGHPTVKAGGRIQLDWALFNQGAASRAVYGDVQDGVEFRRVRIFLRGDAFHVIDYKLQMDFADTDRGDGGKIIQSTAFKDVYFGVNELPWLGHLRIGHYKEPFGLEQLESSKFITFMERSLGDEGAFVPGRRVGLMAFDTYAGQRGTWAIGAFRSEQTNGAEPPFRFDDDGGTAMTMRLTYLPWYDEASEGRGLLHTGLAYSYRDIDDGTVRFQQRPESHMAPLIVDTGNITNVPDHQLAGAEVAFVYGPFSVQSEYFATWVPRTGIGTAYLNGYYAYVSYFLTGEHREYKRSAGTFDRVHPLTNFFRVRTGDRVQTGWGAWEVVYRYSHIDLVDAAAGVNGGLAHDHTFGLNWYLNPYTRLMCNYVLSTSTPAAGVTPVTDMSIFEMRAQIDF